MSEGGRQRNILPHKFGQIFISYVVRTCLILAFIHGAVHARLKESLRGRVRSRSNEFIKFVDIALQIAPKKGRLAITLAGTELKFLTDEEYALFVGLGKVRGGKRIRHKARTLLLVFEQFLITFLIYSRYDQLEVVLDRWNAADGGHRVIISVTKGKLISWLVAARQTNSNATNMHSLDERIFPGRTR